MRRHATHPELDVDRAAPGGGSLGARLRSRSTHGARTELIVLDVPDEELATTVAQRARTLGVTTSRRGALLACEGSTVVALLQDLRRRLTPDQRDRVLVVFPTGATGGGPAPLDDFGVVHAVDLDAILRPGGGGLRAEFQPIVELATGRTVGFEGLIRGHCDGKVIPPDRLFTLARDTARLDALDRAATLAALRDATPWLAGADLFLNFTPSTLDAARVDEVARAASMLSIPATSLVLEIVETERITAVHELSAATERARALGMRVALDDVGAGYASLELLCALAPDIVKVSMGLTHQLPRSQGVIAGLCVAARHVGAEVVLEGIETREQEARARELTIPFGQGFLLGVPGPAKIAASKR